MEFQTLINECKEYIHLPGCINKNLCPDKCDCCKSLDLDKALVELAKNVFERVIEIKNDPTLTDAERKQKIQPRRYALYVIMQAVKLQARNYPLLNELIISLYEASKECNEGES